MVLPEIDDSSTLWGAPASKCRTVVDFWEHHPESVELFYFLQIFVGTEEKGEKGNKKEKGKGNKEEDKEEEEDEAEEEKEKEENKEGTTI